MSQLFVDRGPELGFLKERLGSNEPEFVVIYGRRRVGKTKLVLEFLREERGIYLLATEEGDRENIRAFATEFGKLLGDDGFSKATYPDWSSLFDSLCNHAAFTKERDEKTIIVIDEFPFLIRGNRAVPSIFQKIWEQVLERRNVMLVLLGSSVSAMESEVLGYKSPLYGRRTGQWQIAPLEFRFLGEFFPDYTIEDLANVWFVVGGIPAYLLRFDPHLSFFENVEQKVLKKGSYLHREMDILLRDEFREPRNYRLIFKAISLGYHRLAEICDQTGLDKSMVSKYLDVLDRLHLIVEEKPVLAPAKFRRKRHLLSDQYFSFWFRYVYLNRIELEAMRYGEVLGLVKNDFPTYAGRAFESLVKHLLLTGTVRGPFPFTRIGRQWGKVPGAKRGKNTYEIDLVAVNEATVDILFVECKWKEGVSARRVLAELREKAGNVDWRKGSRKEHFAIFAKSFSRRSDDCLCYDLKDLEKTLPGRGREGTGPSPSMTS